jgi:hypothetical protein
MRTIKSIILLTVLVCLTAVTGCASTEVKSGNPLVQTDPEAPCARVYFLRPRTERSMGVADNVINIELDQRPLLTLAKGDYVYVNLKPGEVMTTIKSMTSWGPQGEVKEMAKGRSFNFVDGETYFIVIRPVDGEFRGVFFVPGEVDLFTAKEIAKRLRAVGDASKQPIAEIQG